MICVHNFKTPVQYSIHAFSCLVCWFPCSFFQLPHKFFSRIFPEVYLGGETPAKYGTIDNERYSTPTPSYRCGWVIPSAELFEALNDEPCPLDDLLPHIHIAARTLLSSLWREKGYNQNEYR